MSRVPGPDDWPALLEAARADSLSLEVDEPVPHGSLSSTVSDECDVAASTATRWIDNSREKGWLRCRGSGADRVYVAADESATLYDDELLDRFVGQDDVQEAEVERALELAVEYYHEQLTDDHRWLIGGKWGIEEATIDALKVGFAPKKNRLPAYLDEHGVSIEAALRSGVVRCGALKTVYEDADAGPDELPPALQELAAAREAGEIAADEISLTAVLEELDDPRLYAWWDARVVFPYRDEGGTIRYLIARKTGDSDDVPGKYLKLANTKPWVADGVVFEPIYGCGTVEPDQDLILTEGITDAIRAHEAGFACISPVTKAFKRDHYDVLLEYAEQAETAFLCFDSEASGVGLDGALRTAWFLQDNGVEALVAELPRGDREEKVDLAEFLKDHSAADLRAILDDAIPASEHPEFEPTVHGDRAGEADSDDVGSSRPRPKKSGRKQSALFDLEISDVIEADSRYGVRPGYRGDNPIAHVGDSHSEYFVYESYGGGMRARDFKAEHTYTPLTWLLCAAGVRSTSSPAGSLDDREIWEAWRYAREQEILGDTDPIPWRARLHIAREHDLAPPMLIDAAADDPARLPPSIHNRILETVETEYGLNPGKDDMETDHEAEQRAELLAGSADDDGDDDQDRGRAIQRMLATLDELNR